MNSYDCLLKDVISEERMTLKMWINLQIIKGFICLFGTADIPSAVQWRLLFCGVYPSVAVALTSKCQR